MSILDNIYKQAGTVSDELKGMNRALTQMQKSDQKEYKLDAQDRKYSKEKDKREKQDQRQFHDKIFDNAERQTQSISKQEHGKKLAAGLASATSAAIQKSLKKKSKEKDLENTPGAGTGGPAFGVQDILLSTPMMSSAPMPMGDDDHEERITKLEQTVFADQTNEVFSKYQSGGFTGAVPNLGQPSTGDHFYTHVEPGSYVLNRNAVQAMGFQGGGNVPVALEQGEIVIPPGQYDQKMMDFINYAAAPRFQGGGVVKAEHPDTGSGFSVGKDYKGRPAVLSKGAAEALQKMISESGGQVKTSDITSAKRSPEKNAAVGGVANSNHLTGNAMDIHGSSKAWLKENGHKYGWKWLDYSGHDGHFDFVGAAGPPAEGETRADPEVKESKSEETSSQEAAQEAGIPEVGSGADLGSLATIGGGLFAPFFEALNNQVFGGGDNKYGLGLGHIMGGVGIGTVAKIGADLLTPGAKADTIPQQQGSKGSGDRSTRNDGKGREEVGAIKPNAKAKDFYLKLIKDGVPKSAAAGIVGNIQAESGFNPAALEAPHAAAGDGRGLIQWSFGRRKNFEKYARRNKLDPNSMQANYEYLLYEMKENDGNHWMPRKDTPKHLRVHSYKEFLEKAKTPERAAKLFMYNYERPNKKYQHLDRRIQAAKGVAGKQRGGLVSLQKAAMSDDMSKFYVQTDNQLMEQAQADVAPQIIEVGGAGVEQPAITMHHTGSNLPTYDLPVRDSCPLSIYYRYHPSLNPQGMSPS